MKKILAILVGLIVLAAPVMAAEEIGETLPVLPDPGITPDSPIYGLDGTAEKLQLAFTFREEKKAELHYKFAQERLSEANEMAEKNEHRYTERLMNQYQNELNETANEIEKAVARGKNVTELIEHVGSMTSKHLEVLQRVYEKVPESAKPAIAHAMEVSVRKQVGVMTHVENGEQMKERVRQQVENQIEGSDTEIKERVRENLRAGMEDTEDETDGESNGSGNSKTVGKNQ